MSLAKGKLPGVVGTNGMLPREPTYPAMHWEQQAYVQIDQVGQLHRRRRLRHL